MGRPIPILEQRALDMMRGINRWVAAAVVMVVAETAPAAAQAPAGWQLDLDAPASAQPSEAGARARADAYSFVEMRPGWHITMGPGGRLFDSASTAADRYAVESNIFLFPGESDEGYGVFFGGSGVGTGASWLAALLRRDGSAALLRHGPGVHEWVVPWAVHEAVKPQAGEEPVGNLLHVDVRRDSVHVFANGTQLYVVPRAGLVTDGTFGLRVGREVNLHVSTLDHTRRLAGVPAGR